MKTCTHCKKSIDTAFEALVDISTYGIYFHAGCFVATTGPEMVRYMGQDETLLRQPGKSGGLRARDPRVITAEGTVTGAVQHVDW